MSNKNEAKHTPGPWLVAEAKFVNGGVSFIVLADNMVISAANANLIATAPEMLETLEEISCQFSADIKEGKITATVTLNPTKIRSLIAKATGDK